MNFRKPNLCLIRYFIGVICLFYLPYLNAEEFKISYLIGKANITRNTEKIEVKINTTVKENDILTTSANSTLILNLDESSRLKLKELTTIQMVKNQPDNRQIKFNAGGLFAQIVKGIATTKLQVITLNCVIAVRGTEFFAAYGKKKKTGADLWLCVNEGSVSLNKEETQEELVIKQGQGVNVKPGMKFPTPQQFKWTKKLNWNMYPDRGNVIDKTSINAAYGELLRQDYE